MAMKIVAKLTAASFLPALLLALFPFTTPVAHADEEDDFAIIDEILGRSGNALATKWRGVYFGGTALAESTQYSYTVDSLVNSSVSSVAGNVYPNVASGILSRDSGYLGVILGRNYIDQSFLIGVEGILAVRVGSQKEQTFGQQLWITTPDNNVADPSSSKRERTDVAYSDNAQTNVFPQGGVAFNGSLEVRMRLGYIDDDLLYYTAIGYATTNWLVRARANINTVFTTGTTTATVVSREEVVRGISVALGVEYAITPALFGRLELASYSYPTFTTSRNSNGISFNLEQDISTSTLGIAFTYNFQ